MDIEVPALDRDRVLAEANTEMGITRTLIDQNNPQATVWSQRVNTQIDGWAAEKRKQLIDFHGG